MQKQPDPVPGTYRILSLDGGGLRGVLTSVILERIVAEYPDFLQKVDLIAGTSTGAILGLALAMGLPPEKITQLYLKKGSSIFSHTILGDAAHLFGLAGAKYATEPRYRALHEVFGETKLGELKKQVVVASVDLDSATGPENDPTKPPQWKAKFFHNFEGDDSDGDQLAVDVAMRSSAAPVYFPIYQGFIDGGMVANNPSMCALTQALAPKSGGRDPKDVVLLSIGTGGAREYVDSLSGNWGLAEWNIKLVSLPLGASEGVADYQCKQILGNCYQRIQPDLPAAIGLDDVGKVPLLEQLGRGCNISTQLAWIGQRW